MISLVLFAFFSISSGYNFYESSSSSGRANMHGLLTGEELNDTCLPILNGYQWVLSQRRTDYGWGDQTHRAIIVLALNDFGGLPRQGEETMLMEHQLEVELTRAILRNETKSMLLSDLALYIHALIITNKDPRDFYGLNLVEILKSRTDKCVTRENVNAYALLVLSDTRIIEKTYMNLLREVLSVKDRHQIEVKAIALHAMACAVEDDEFRQYSDIVSRAAADFARSQNPDGSFGNIYTTALIMQALVAAGYTGWNEDEAKNFILSKRSENVNMVSTYYTERALNAHKIRCIKTLYSVPPTSPDGLPTLQDIKRWPRHHYVQYTLMVGDYPDVYFTITLKVAQNATFFDIMRMAAAEDEKYRFSYHIDEHGIPHIYSLSGIPNNAEESLYWKLVVETEVNHDRHTSKREPYISSPNTLIPEKDSHLIYQYTEAFGPSDNI